VPTTRDTYVLDVQQSAHSIKQSPQDVVIAGKRQDGRDRMEREARVRVMKCGVNWRVRFRIFFK
jgi:hypothetical protein